MKYQNFIIFICAKLFVEHKIAKTWMAVYFQNNKFKSGINNVNVSRIQEKFKNFQNSKKYASVRNTIYRDEGKQTQKMRRSVGIPAPFCTLLQFIIHVYCFTEGHDVMMKFLNTTMTVFEQNQYYALTIDVFSWEYLDDAFVVPSLLAADVIAERYINDWSQNKNKRNIYKVKARIKVILQSLVTIDLLKTYNQFGPNPNIKETPKNKDFIDFLKNADVGNEKKNIFSICARCYPDWITNRVNLQNQMLDENGKAVFGNCFNSIKPPQNMVKSTKGVSNTSFESCMHHEYSFFKFMMDVVEGNENMKIGYMKKILEDDTSASSDDKASTESTEENEENEEAVVQKEGIHTNEEKTEITATQYAAMKHLRLELYSSDFSAMTDEDHQKHLSEISEIESKLFSYEKANLLQDTDEEEMPVPEKNSEGNTEEQQQETSQTQENDNISFHFEDASQSDENQTSAKKPKESNDDDSETSETSTQQKKTKKSPKRKRKNSDVAEKRKQKRIENGRHYNAFAQMLGKDASDFLIPAQQYLDIKFNEKAIMKGVKEENPYALRLFQDVFESKIEQKKTRSKKTDKDEDEDDEDESFS